MPVRKKLDSPEPGVVIIPLKHHDDRPLAFCKASVSDCPDPGCPPSCSVLPAAHFSPCRHGPEKRQDDRTSILLRHLIHSLFPFPIVRVILDNKVTNKPLKSAWVFLSHTQCPTTPPTCRYSATCAVCGFSSSEGLFLGTTAACYMIFYFVLFIPISQC